MSYQVTIEPLGEVVEIEEGQNILDACLRAGIWLPHACCHGLCATCKVQVLEGDIDHGPASPFALMDFEREEGKCLACCAMPESDIVIEADIDEEPDARRIPLQDFNGKIVKIENLTPTIKGIFIELEDDTGMDFQAGQYVNVHLPMGDEVLTRAFSLSNAPHERILELNVRLVPGGRGTTYLHESLQEGDDLTISGPFGRFFVRKSQPENLLFLAGGSGLSSPKSMILDLLEADKDSRHITLVYGARTRKELYYHDLFTKLAEKHTNFTYIPALSEAPAEGDHWEGKCGFVHEVAKAHFDNDFRGNKAYLCGPPVMIDACITTLMQGRLFERDIYTEKFISAADAAQAATRSPLFRKI